MCCVCLCARVCADMYVYIQEIVNTCICLTCTAILAFILFTNLASFWVVREVSPSWSLFYFHGFFILLVIQYFLLGWCCTFVLVLESTFWKYWDVMSAMQRNGIPRERIQLCISVYFSNKAHITQRPLLLLLSSLWAGCLFLLCPSARPLFLCCSSGERSWSWFVMLGSSRQQPSVPTH